jgi:hypothetical protein
MKKVISLLVIIVIAFSSKAQLSNTRWKGTLQLDNPLDAVFDFGKDTLNVFRVDDNSLMEAMVYTANDSIFTLQKITGQSDCGSSEIGRYRYKRNGDALLVTLLEDVCNDRSSVLNNFKLTRQSKSGSR